MPIEMFLGYRNIHGPEIFQAMDNGQRNQEYKNCLNSLEDHACICGDDMHQSISKGDLRLDAMKSQLTVKRKPKIMRENHCKTIMHLITALMDLFLSSAVKINRLIISLNIDYSIL
jgi:hypothetical protein